MPKETQAATDLRILAVLADSDGAPATVTDALRGCIKTAHGMRVLQALDEWAKAKKGAAK